MKEFIVKLRIRVNAVDANDAVEQAEEVLAIGNYQAEEVLAIGNYQLEVEEVEE